MKVIDIIKGRKKTLFSFEILPPIKGKGIKTIYENLDPLMELNPAFINVTYHRSEYIYKKKLDGSFQKTAFRKRPGTVGICAAIKNKYNIDPVPHLICGGFTKEETENALIDLHFLGINNILILRGDPPANESSFKPEPEGNASAIELLDQIMRMNRGLYLGDEMENTEHTDFCVGVAGYPEKHIEAPNMASDLYYLKKKVEGGADYITTQMFFDNKKYFSFVKTCREKGITVPIIPGLKPLTSKRQLTVLPRIFNIDIPEELAGEVRRCKTKEDVKRVGEEWLLKQCLELQKADVPVLHFYTLRQSKLVRRVVEKLI